MVRPPLRLTTVLCAAIATICLGPEPALAAPPEYVETAEALAAPLYPTGARRPDLNLEAVLNQEGPRLAFLGASPIRAASLRDSRNAASSHAADSAAALLALAGIENVKPSNTVLLRRGFEAMVGDEEAEQRLENTLGAVIVAEIAKAGFRASYRESLVGRRNAAWQLWEAADQHDGPQFIQSQSGIGVQVQQTDRGVVIANVFENRPAAQAGLRAGDRFLAVDGIRIPSANQLDAVTSRLKGRHGTPVSVEVDRNGRRLSFDLRRNAALPASVLAVDFNCSWKGAFSDAWLSMRNNSGQDLTDVTLFVLMKRPDGSAIGHTHFTRRWDGGEVMNAIYKRESMYTSQEDLDGLATIELTLMSDQGWAQQTYVYSGPEAETDMIRWMEDVEFYAGHLQPETYWISDFNQPSGVSLSFEGRSHIPAEAVTVTIVDGSISQSIRWTMDGLWSSGSLGQKSFRDSRFDGLTPDRVTYAIELPGCREPYTITWDR